MAILSANTSPKLQERKAAENAKALLGTLTPSSTRTDRTIFVLRYAANLAKKGTLARLERRHTLDHIRIKAATGLNEVCRLLDRGHLPQDAIEQATDAVIAWLAAFLRPAAANNFGQKHCAASGGQPLVGLRSRSSNSAAASDVEQVPEASGAQIARLGFAKPSADRTRRKM
jgi:hypothetical protein